MSTGSIVNGFACDQVLLLLQSFTLAVLVLAGTIRVWEFEARPVYVEKGILPRIADTLRDATALEEKVEQ